MYLSLTSRLYSSKSVISSDLQRLDLFLGQQQLMGAGARCAGVAPACKSAVLDRSTKSDKQTNNRTLFLSPEDAGFLVSATEAELQLFIKWTSTRQPSLPSAPAPSQETQLKAAGGITACQKRRLACRRIQLSCFMSLRNDDNPGSSCTVI